jgi:hypothetical protein
MRSVAARRGPSLCQAEGRLHPCDLHFNAAIIGMVVFANAIGKVDAAAFV